MQARSIVHGLPGRQLAARVPTKRVHTSPWKKHPAQSSTTTSRFNAIKRFQFSKLNERAMLGHFWLNAGYFFGPIDSSLDWSWSE